MSTEVPEPLRVLVAPDAFKGTADAATAAEALAAGWLSVRPGDETVVLPLADGGEGTLDAVARAVPGAVRVPVTGVPGPNGLAVDGAWLRLPDGTGVVELAAVSGLPLLDRPDPLGAHTAGLGAVIADALRAGVTALVVAVGGSASTDGGTGALTALGARFLDRAGRALPLGGAALSRLASADLSALAAAPPGGIEILTDVRNPLLGDQGAARTSDHRRAPHRGTSRPSTRRCAAWRASSAAIPHCPARARRAERRTASRRPTARPLPPVPPGSPNSPACTRRWHAPTSWSPERGGSTQPH